MKEVSYNELFNNTQIDLSVFFEDDFTFPRSFELSTILYRVVHMNVPLVLEPMIERLNQIDPSFAESLQAFVIEFQKWDDLIEDWKQVIRDDIDSALSIIGQKNESAYRLLQEKIGLISVTEPEEIYSVLHHYGAFCVIPPVYSPIFDEFICCKRVWEPFCIYSDYSADVSDDLQRKVSYLKKQQAIICCYIDNNLCGENKAEQIVCALESLSASNDGHCIGAVVTSKDPFHKINDNIFIDCVEKDHMDQLKGALLRSVYHYLLHSIKEHYLCGISSAFSKAASHRNIALYLSEMARYEGISNYTMLTEWLKGLTEYYTLQSNSIEKLISIANLIERQDDTEPMIDEDLSDLSDINTFEAFDYSVNRYFQSVEPGDIFISEDNRVYILVGQACDMAMGESRNRRNGLCEMIEASFLPLPTLKKISDDQEHMWINHFIKDASSGSLKINYQKRLFVENEVLSLSSYNADGICRMPLNGMASNPIMQEYQISYYDDLKLFFNSIMLLKSQCNAAAETVLANRSINWVCTLLDYNADEDYLKYPLRRVCRLREKYLLFLYKLFLEYRGRIPFNTVNMNRTVSLSMTFFYLDKSTSGNVDVWLNRPNKEIKLDWPWFISGQTVKKILSEMCPGINVKTEEEKYLVEGRSVELLLSDGKSLRLSKKTKTSLTVSIQ